MPMYTYTCECGREIVEYRSVAERGNVPTCECGSKMVSMWWKTSNARKLGEKYGKPIEMWSMAVHPSQVAEHRHLFPDIKVTDGGLPLITSLREKQDYMKARGWIDRNSYY